MNTNSRARILQRLKDNKRQQLTLNESTILHDASQEEVSDAEAEIVQEQNDSVNSDDNIGDAERNLTVFEFGPPTQKGGGTLWDGGYRFTKNAYNTWRCDRFNYGCQASFRAVRKIDENQMKGRYVHSEHNHVPNPAKKPAESNRVKLKRSVNNGSRIKSAKVLTQIRGSLPDEVVMQMGKDGPLRQMLRREKRKKFGNVDCADPISIQFTDALLIKDDESILVYDSRDVRQTEDVVLVFAHPKMLEILSNETTWHCDGNLKAAPKPFTQALVIGVSVKRKLVICCHALLPEKEQKYYLEVFDAVKRATSGLPKKVISDLIPAEIGALLNVFPQINLDICLFNFAQDIWQIFHEMKLQHMMQSETLAPNRNNYPEFVGKTIGEMTRFSFSALVALPFIPSENVRQAFMQITNFAPTGLEGFLFYFCKTFIGLTQLEIDLENDAFKGTSITLNPARIDTDNSRSSQSVSFANSFSSRNSFGQNMTASSNQSVLQNIVVLRWEAPIVRPPLFEIELWNLRQRAEGGIARANNLVETAHFHFSRQRRVVTLSALLVTIMEDIDKQSEIYHGIKNDVAKKRKHRHVIQEKSLQAILRGAKFDQDLNVIAHLYELGLLLQGFVQQLVIRKRAEDNEPLMDDSVGTSQES